MLKGFLTTCIVLALIAGGVYCIWNTPEPIPTSYVKTVIVDDSGKIEQAISNAVNDVSSRNFVVTCLGISRDPITKTFKIKCGGLDRGNVLALEP